ncbi:uncharacterized protein LOC135117874 [Helicoverpa armigera]|uniref:uncharacterized protein LOC135117874 n=1 Tax=Helicoverpa armigera TaxID=29058 RepID=UPI0030837EA6
MTITLAGMPLSVCPHFRYLGSLVQSDGEVDRDVMHRINSGWMQWRQVTSTIYDSTDAPQTEGQNLQIRNKTCRPVWIRVLGIEKKDENRVHVAKMRMLRWMCGLTEWTKSGMSISEEA